MADDHDFKKGKYKPIVRISTDGYHPYIPAINEVFGPYAEHAILVKTPTTATERKKMEAKGEKKRWVRINKQVISGEVDEDDISTSLVERHNLTLRQFNRRLTRKTNGYSRCEDHLVAAVALHFAHYNYVWEVSTLKTTPAVAAGIAGKPFSWCELFDLVRDCAAEPWPVG